MSNRQTALSAIPIASALLLSACDQISVPFAASPKLHCQSERSVAGWTVAAGLEKAQSGDTVIQKWEARRNFSTFFGLRITYDTKEAATPFLQVWHDYKTGAFLMRLVDGNDFTLQLDARYAVTYGVLPETVFDQLSRTPLRIEHTSHTNKWSVYKTEGLPEAIAAAQADLHAIRRQQANGECSL